MEIIEEQEEDADLGRYTSTNHLQTFSMERDVKVLKHAERRAALDVWIGMIVSEARLGEYNKEKLHVSNSGGRSLLTRMNSTDQSSHNNFEFKEGNSYGFLYHREWF